MAETEFPLRFAGGWEGGTGRAGENASDGECLYTMPPDSLVSDVASKVLLDATVGRNRVLTLERLHLTIEGSRLEHSDRLARFIPSCYDPTKDVVVAVAM